MYSPKNQISKNILFYFWSSIFVFANIHQNDDDEIEIQSKDLSRVDKSLKLLGLHKIKRNGFWLKSKFRFGMYSLLSWLRKTR